MRITITVLTIVVGLVLLGGCGGGSGSVTTPVKFRVSWAARSRTLLAPSSALSITLTIGHATSTVKALVYTVNRPSDPAAQTADYTSTSGIAPGPWALQARFYSQPDGTGDMVAEADADVTIQPDGSGIGDITTVSDISVVQLTAIPNTVVGQSRPIQVTVIGSHGALTAISPGSIFFTLTEGADKAKIEAGQITGTAIGTAGFHATVDGVNSALLEVNFYTPAVSTIVYVRNGTLWRMNPDGSDQAQITTDTQDVYTEDRDSPALSPDGTKVAYNGITVLDLANLHVHRAFSGYSPSWFADGTRILSSNGIQVFIDGPDGTAISSPQTLPDEYREAALAPDDTEFAAVHSSQNGGPTQLAIASIDGTLKLLGPAGTYLDHTPAWSPDGNRIAEIVSGTAIDVDGPGGQQQRVDSTGGLFLVAPDLKHRTVLYNPAGVKLYQPSWSPDGTKIVFDDGSQIWCINSDGSSPHVLAPGTAPNWGVAIN